MKRPHRFLIEVEPAFSGPTSYSIDHGILRRKSKHQPEVTLTPKIVDWHGFWRFCDFIEIWKWKTEYSPSDVDLIFRDGITWKLEISYDKSKHVRARGNNVYPSFCDTKSSVVTMDRFGLLLNFVDSMLKPTDDGLKLFYADEDLG